MQPKFFTSPEQLCSFSLAQPGCFTQRNGKGVGRALLLASLWALRELGYVYAIIGAAGPVRFYQKTVGAIIIPDSEPGIYTDALKTQE